MRLHSLLRPLDPPVGLDGIPDISVTGIQDDSRRVRDSDLFVARPGTQSDGASFAIDAEQRGAAAVVTHSRIAGLKIPQVVVPNVAIAASVLANVFHADPSQFMSVLGITGTNGKTTTAYLIRHILNSLQRKSGMIGTVEIDDGANQVEASLTTPGSIEVAELLASMKRNHCRACAMEVSSHALHQHRVDGVRFAGAGFTNLTGDHLDYHKSMHAYAAAKARLFELLPADAVAAINADDPHREPLVHRCDARIVTFGIRHEADYRATDFAVTARGTSYVLNAPDGKTEVSLKLIGRHNIENSLCAIALCCEAFGLTIHQVATALRSTIGAPGRLQTVQVGQPFSVLVDYAHTDDALANVLTALRPLTRGKLRVVFGCGGDRDRTKRPRMAAVAQKLADVVYVTSDNPRTEDPQAIIHEILTGFTLENRGGIEIEADRRTAIERAVSQCDAGDVLLIAGKGHENYQIVGTTKHHFDDVEEATRAITVAARA